MRRRRSYLRSFGNGLVLAAIPVAAFVAVDYLLAPPSDGVPQGSEIAQSQPAPQAPVTRIGQFATRTGEPAAPTAVEGSQRADTKSVAAEPVAAQPVVTQTVAPHSSLVHSIQQELARVGCFNGSFDGVWGERTKAAMTAFNSSVHVSLATDKPDYILLTLLQGHNAKACIERTIEARNAAPAVKASETAAVTTTSGSWTSTVTAAPSASRVAAQTQPKTLPLPTLPRATAVAPSAQEPRAVIASTEPVAPSAPAGEPLAGRMSVGVMAPAPQLEPLPAPVHVQPAQRQRPASNAGSNSSASSSNWRNRTFSDLARNAP